MFYLLNIKLINGTDEETDQEQNDEDIELIRNSAETNDHQRKVNLATPKVAQALDRAGVSDRGASLILQAIADDNHVEAEVKTNFMTIRRARMKVRKELAAQVRRWVVIIWFFVTNLFLIQIKEEFNPDVPLCLHWDGKILPNFEGKKEDRLAIVVTGANVSKMLAIPSVPDGKSETETQAIVETVESWDLQDRIVAMSFDTTNVNAGVHNGVIAKLPKLLKRPLLALACRHHVAELLLKHTFELATDSSRSDKLDDFRTFQVEYNANGFYHNPPSFRTVLDSSKNRKTAEPWRSAVIEFCVLQLGKSHARGDYVELLELTLIFLGEAPPKGIKFRKAGSLSRARWMARAIYTLKAWMFQDSIKLFDADMLSHLETMCFFITQCYVIYWFQVSSAVSFYAL